MSRRAEILEQVRHVPDLPSTAGRVLQIVQDPDLDISELAGAIEYDPGITANVLRLANSAYFAGPGQVASLKDAVVRLGLNRIHQLVLAAALSSLVRQRVSGYDHPPGELLRHAVFVAIATEKIGRTCGKTPPAAAFTAGLMHNVGKTVLGTFVKVDAQPIVQVAQDAGLSFELAEEKVLGIGHAEVGAVLLEQWGLPYDVVQAVRWHHQPEMCPRDGLIVDLVHMADALAMKSGIGVGVDGLNYHLSDTTVERLEMKTVLVETVVCDVLIALDELGDFFAPEPERR